jgi:hypothetical protein
LYRYFCGRLASRRERYSTLGDVALEIDHARTIGGSPSAPLRAFPFGTNRTRNSGGCVLRRIRVHCGRGIWHAVGSPVLIKPNREKRSPRFGVTLARQLRLGHTRHNASQIEDIAALASVFDSPAARNGRLSGRLKYQIRDRVRLRYQGKMARLHLDCPRAHALCHERAAIHQKAPTKVRFNCAIE